MSHTELEGDMGSVFPLMGRPIARHDLFLRRVEGDCSWAYCLRQFQMEVIADSLALTRSYEMPVRPGHAASARKRGVQRDAFAKVFRRRLLRIASSRRRAPLAVSFDGRLFRHAESALHSNPQVYPREWATYEDTYDPYNDESVLDDFRHDQFGFTHHGDDDDLDDFSDDDDLA